MNVPVFSVCNEKKDSLLARRADLWVTNRGCRFIAKQLSCSYILEHPHCDFRNVSLKPTSST